MKRYSKVFIVLALLTLVTATVYTQGVWAQNDPSGPNGIEQNERGNRGDRGDRPNVIDREVVKAAIASALNMTVDELDAAKESGQSWEEIAETQGVPYEDVVAAAKVSMSAQVNQALANGEITQEQADQMLERIDNMDSLERRRGNRGDRGNRANRGDRGDRGDRADFIDRDVVNAAVAGALNMSVEELDAAKEAGQRMEEIAEAQGVAIEDVQAAKKAAIIEQINQAVTDGVITSEEAARMIERIENGRQRRNTETESASDESNENGTGTDETVAQATNTVETNAVATGLNGVVATTSTVLFLPTIAGR